MEVIRFVFAEKNLLEHSFFIRKKVFVQEQEVSEEEEFDQFDDHCIHYLTLVDDVPCGTARWRITENGIKLERFAVLKEYRNKGVGKAILNKMLKEIPNMGTIYMHAQVRVTEFYSKFGFKKVGDLFMECDIEHFKMVLNPQEISANGLQHALSSVEKFHNSFGLFVSDEPRIEIDPSLIKLRHELMKEENDEYVEAAQRGDMVEVADALGDMLYILCGSILTHGLQHKIEDIFNEIQRSNMSKLDQNGKPIYREDGKVLKSELYFKPDIQKILSR